MRMSARFEILLYNEPFAEELQLLVFAKGYSLPTGWKVLPPDKRQDQGIEERPRRVEGEGLLHGHPCFSN